ncbi:hypothetical protein DPM13_09325 [Paracoccus mutanolyticus]|uniref:Resolvase/invertase-type recombinase catalytic domain-containing protein n=1 Tax=Paracoccus mutanolyticus TaxID=1499308 RepID=A0ABM6WRQ2_9RHOB|nr:hypothetical protein DPM13_09325 [Paracoccus mutanolyticus]
MILGYARVSTDDQTLDAQTDALQAAGAGRVFADRISGSLRKRPQLDRLPEIVVEDAQFRHLLDYPVLFRIEPGLTLAGIGILDEALAVPDDPADIHLVVEDAVAALRIP